MPLVFIDGELLFVDGNLAMDESCCCEEVPDIDACEPTDRELLEVSVEISGVSIGLTGGCSCASIPLSAVLPYDLSFDGSSTFQFSWGLSGSLGCAGPGGATLYWHLGVGILCFLGNYRIEAVLAAIPSPVFNDIHINTDWQLEWDLLGLSGFLDIGTPYTLNFDAFSSDAVGTKCDPSVSSSTMAVTFNFA